MLKIRLQRTGRKHEPTFRVVLTDSKNSTKSGKYLEKLGSYDPRKENESFDAERIKYWISKGAQPSDTLHNLLVSKKIIEGKKRNVSPKRLMTVKGAPEAPAEPTSSQESVSSEKESPSEASVKTAAEADFAEESASQETPVAEESGPTAEEAPAEEPKAQA